MKKFVLFLILSFSLIGFSQQKPNFWDHVQYGGGFTLGFGNNQTTVGISPSAIYNFKNGFSLGTGVSYLYSEINNFSTSVYGASIISLYPSSIIQYLRSHKYLFQYIIINSG